MPKFTKVKEIKGITIIALVVTIIILLILAGISITTLTGDNGLIKNARRCKRKGRYRYRKGNCRNFYYTSNGTK